MSGECQVNVKSQSELDIGGRETCFFHFSMLSITSAEKVCAVFCETHFTEEGVSVAISSKGPLDLILRTPLCFGQL